MKNFVNSIIRFLFNLQRPTKVTNLKSLQVRGELLDDFVIREATEADIPALATLHVQTWRETYPHVKQPPDYTVREPQWRQQFAVADGSWFCYIVENKKNGLLVGFAKGMKYAHADLPDFSGEINKIYLLRQYQRLGLGRRLLEHVARRFLSMGIHNAVLFGDPKNPSGLFHEALGAEKLYAKNGSFDGGYAWRDLQQLATICSIN